MTNRSRNITGLGLVLLVLLLSACAVRETNNFLNSDRILQQFGSYGVEILFAEPHLRITSLYSVVDDNRVTRTLAIVQFSKEGMGSVQAQHREIVAGGSIGAVFRAAGWQINKHNVFVGEVFVDHHRSRIASLMKIMSPDRLAAHSYSFAVENEQLNITYATITEIHHPDYLTVVELQKIFGATPVHDPRKRTLADLVSLPDAF